MKKCNTWTDKLDFLKPTSLYLIFKLIIKVIILFKLPSIYVKKH